MNKITITLNQTADNLDPNHTSSNPHESLAAYLKEVEARIKAVYPDADVDHNEIDDTYAFRVVCDDPEQYEEIMQEVQDITESVYELGNFWA